MAHGTRTDRMMNTRAQIRMLPDGRRVHMQDGPIDLIVEAFGEPDEVDRAYHAAAARFMSVLDELCSELAFLRQPADPSSSEPDGSVARRMMEAVRPHAARRFITPIAAVAGAVAEEVLDTITSTSRLARAYVNDGGDIALHLTPGENFVVGMMEYPEPDSKHDQRSLHSMSGITTIRFEDAVRGIATSGWRGRSFSLGIADAVTVLADTASMADAAATIIANAVDLPGHPAVLRARARDLAPDSDLGDRMVTQAVAALSLKEIQRALDAGIDEAESLRSLGLIRAAAISLQRQVRIVDAATSLFFQPNAVQVSSNSGSLVHA
jgi:uncharacterized protein